MTLFIQEWREDSKRKHYLRRNKHLISTKYTLIINITNYER